jgi:hypothetical protein
MEITMKLFKTKMVFIIKLKSSIDLIKDAKTIKEFKKQIELIKIDCDNLLDRKEMEDDKNK